MPIIINEFEIVTEPAQPESEPAGPAPTQGVPPTLHPEDITRVMLRQEARLERVRAD